MPITGLISDSSIQHVCAICEESRVLSMAQLTAGTQRGDHVDPCIIALPVCTGCGASEFLIRTPSEEELARVTPGSYGYLHRLLVDRIHQRLVDNGRLVEGAAIEDIKPLPPPEPELESWLSNDPTLPLPSTTDSDSKDT